MIYPIARILGLAFTVTVRNWWQAREERKNAKWQFERMKIPSLEVECSVCGGPAIRWEPGSQNEKTICWDSWCWWQNGGEEDLVARGLLDPREEGDIDPAPGHNFENSPAKILQGIFKRRHFNNERLLGRAGGGPEGGGAVDRRDAGDAGKQSATGTVVTFYGSVAGVGRTVIAINLAAVLAQSGYKVALVDLDIRFGDISIFLDIAAEQSIADLPVGDGKLTAHALQRCLHTHGTGVTVLPAPVRPAEWRAVGSAHVAQAIALLAQSHDYVILDSPKYYKIVSAALQPTDTLLLVTTNDEYSLEFTKRDLRMLGWWCFPSDRVKVVANATNEATIMDSKGIERVLGHVVFASVPYDRAINTATELGTPLVVAHPDSKAAESIRHLADMLTERSGPSAAQPTQREQRKEELPGMRLFGKKQEPPREAGDFDPAVFDYPIAVLLSEITRRHGDHQLNLNAFQTTCDASVESAEEVGIPFVTDWVETACKVGSTAIVEMLVSPEVDYLAWPGHVPTDHGIKRALSVMAVAFGWIFAENERHRWMIDPFTGPEFIRICTSSIDPLGASFLDSLAQRTKEGGVALAFGTFRALHVALWAPELDAVPGDDQELFLKARDWPPRLTEAGFTTPVVTRKLIGHWYVHGVIPRLTELIRRHSGSN